MIFKLISPSFPKSIRILFAPLFVALFSFFCVACDDPSKKVHRESHGKDVAPPLGELIPENPEPIDEKSKEIEKLTGAHTRFVWSEQVDSGKTDKHGNGSRFVLKGLDTRDGKGERTILGEVGNYVRPLLTPDGQQVIFTEKGTTRHNDNTKSYEPKSFIVNFNGSGRRDLGPGYVEDVWVDPSTGKSWAYTLVDFRREDGSAITAKRLERFPLDEPAARKVIYKKDVSPNNFMLSRNGKVAAGLFPWNAGGRMDMQKSTWEQFTRGCWTSLCPDNSYLLATFDGAHQNLTMTDSDGEEWVMAINELPELQRKEVYHPRWTNHPLFFTMTGPYASKAKSPGEKVELYLGKFSNNISRVESVIKVTENKLAESFPDAWIAGGETLSLDYTQGLGPGGKAGELKVAQVTETKEVESIKVGEVSDRKEETPTNKNQLGEDGLVFLWHNGSPRAQNKVSVGDDQISCDVVVSGKARFGRHFELVLGGGSAKLDEAAVESLNPLIQSGPATISMAVTPAEKQSGEIFHFGGVTVGQEEEKFFFSFGQKKKTFGSAIAGEQTILTLIISPENLFIFQGETEQDIQTRRAIDEVDLSRLRFGDGKWEGTVAGISISNCNLTDSQRILTKVAIKENLLERTELPRITFRGKVKEVGKVRDVEDLEQYLRLLVPVIYEVTEVIDGEMPQNAEGTPQELFVWHWAIMNRVPLKSFPPEADKIHTLSVESIEGHPQLKNELKDFIDNPAYDLHPQFFDPSTPSS